MTDDTASRSWPVDRLYDVLNLLAARAPKEQNIAAIFEDTEVGRTELEVFLGLTPPSWRLVLQRQLPQMRLAGTRYIGFLGNLTHPAGGLAAAARSESEVLDGMLPWFIERLLTVGATCPFVLAVSEPVRVAIERRLSALQPVFGGDGQHDAATYLRELRAGYAVADGPKRVNLMDPRAVWGGRSIAGDRIAYTSERLVEAAHAFQTGIARAWLTENAAGIAALRAAGRAPLIFEAMPGGVLRLTGVLPSGDMVPFDFAAGEWVEDAAQ